MIFLSTHKIYIFKDDLLINKLLEIIEKFSNDMIEKGNMVKFLKWDNKGHQFYRWDKEAYPEVISELIKFMKEN